MEEEEEEKELRATDSLCSEPVAKKDEEDEMVPASEIFELDDSVFDETIAVIEKKTEELANKAGFSFKTEANIDRVVAEFEQRKPPPGPRRKRAATRSKTKQEIEEDAAAQRAAADSADIVSDFLKAIGMERDAYLLKTTFDPSKVTSEGCISEVAFKLRAEEIMQENVVRERRIHDPEDADLLEHLNQVRMREDPKMNLFDDRKYSAHFRTGFKPEYAPPRGGSAFRDLADIFAPPEDAEEESNKSATTTTM